jgi:hypothetical protein
LEPVVGLLVVVLLADDIFESPPSVYWNHNSPLNPGRFSLPNPKQASAIWDDVWCVEAHNSTGIEGNTLVLREVKALLQTQRVIGGKELKDYLEVEGYGKAAKWVYAQARAPKNFVPEGLLYITELRHIHELPLESIWKVEPHKNALPSHAPSIQGLFRRHGCG